MTEPSPSMKSIAKRIRMAVDSSDLVAFEELLDPQVTWGAPHDKNPGCKSRNQVLAWYGRGKAAGAEGRVSAVEIVGKCVVLELVVRRTKRARERGTTSLRWQVDTIREGRVIEIVGFDDHSEAIAYAEAKATDDSD
jgi:hypothetical protein